MTEIRLGHRQTVDLVSDDDDDDEAPARRRIQFARKCTVIEIPHYREYSPAQKEALWNGRKKIRRMAKTNTLEYQFDGWKLESAAEEHQFIATEDGESLHPWHAHKKKKAAPKTV